MENHEEIKGLRIDLQALSKSLEKSAKSTDKIAVVGFLLSLVQFFVAVSQLILSFAYSDNLNLKLLGTFMVFAAMFILWFFGMKIFATK